MSVRRLMTFGLAFAIGLVTGWMLHVPSQRHTGSVADLRSIAVDRPAPPDTDPRRIETQLRVDRIYDQKGRIVWQNNVPQEANKPAWKLNLDGYSVYAVPE